MNLNKISNVSFRFTAFYRWRRQWLPTTVLLPGKPHGWRSLVGCSPWVLKSRTRLSDFTFTFHFHALEKEMATHSSVLAWRIPGMGEPDWLPSMGSHRVGNDWSDLAAVAASFYRGKFASGKDDKLGLPGGSGRSLEMESQLNPVL